MTAEVVPFRRKGAAVTPLLGVGARPVAEPLHERLDRLRAVPSIHEPRCDAAPWPSVLAAARLVYHRAPGLCASCRGPISVTAEWCCEPCAIGRGHSDNCRVT
jgi:hypothetical protein